MLSEIYPLSPPPPPSHTPTRVLTPYNAGDKPSPSEIPLATPAARLLASPLPNPPPPRPRPGETPPFPHATSVWLKQPQDVLTPAHAGRRKSTSLSWWLFILLLLLLLPRLLWWLWWWLWVKPPAFPGLTGTQTDRGADAARGLCVEARDQPSEELLALEMGFCGRESTLSPNTCESYGQGGAGGAGGRCTNSEKT